MQTLDFNTVAYPRRQPGRTRAGRGGITETPDTGHGRPGVTVRGRGASGALAVRLSHIRGGMSAEEKIEEETARTSNEQLTRRRTMKTEKSLGSKPRPESEGHRGVGRRRMANVPKMKNEDLTLIRDRRRLRAEHVV